MAGILKYDTFKELFAHSEIQTDIIDYTENKFILNDLESDHQMVDLPFEDEYFINDWYNYVEQTKEQGTFETLKSIFVTLNFPIEKGISKSHQYRSATLQGKPLNFIPTATGLPLEDPNGLQLELHQSIAGKLPVLIIKNSNDFKTVVRALCHKNEPVAIPDSMGAAMIKGINNWRKIRLLKEDFLEKHAFSEWNDYFKTQLIPTRSLYQDKIIILSDKPYSAVSCKTFHMNSREWKQSSLKIRLEHECAHYFTLRQFGTMNHNMHDELIADYAGICAAYGSFNAQWFLKFMGLEEFPKYRQGGRLENYLGNPPLSSKSQNILKKIVYKAALNIQQFDSRIENRENLVIKRVSLSSICATSILEMAQENGADVLYANFLKQLSKVKANDI